ncbi:hypothetical protein [Duganella sp. P38]|uniref:hypothetical protein n=1 Tax=Duganella sp. P38 TaxID=3423949 RepID=UPI003D7994CB
MATTSAPRKDAEPSAYAICNLLLLMPHLPLIATSELNYSAADPALLVQLADAADAALLIIHIGTAAIGRLLARAATDPFGEEERADVVESLGWLVAELNDLATVAHKISGRCRQLTYDYSPEILNSLPLVKT